MAKKQSAKNATAPKGTSPRDTLKIHLGKLFNRVRGSLDIERHNHRVELANSPDNSRVDDFYNRLAVALSFIESFHLSADSPQKSRDEAMRISLTLAWLEQPAETVGLCKPDGVVDAEFGCRAECYAAGALWWLQSHAFLFESVGEFPSGDGAKNLESYPAWSEEAHRKVRNAIHSKERFQVFASLPPDDPSEQLRRAVKGKGETSIPQSEAALLFESATRNSIENWRRHGLATPKGRVYLRSFNQAGSVYTTREEVGRFQKATNKKPRQR